MRVRSGPCQEQFEDNWKGLSAQGGARLEGQQETGYHQGSCHHPRGTRDNRKKGSLELYQSCGTSWKEAKLESGLPGEKSMASDVQMTPPLWQKAKKN